MPIDRSVTLPADLIRRLKSGSRAFGTTINELVAIAIRDFDEPHPPEAPPVVTARVTESLVLSLSAEDELILQKLGERTRVTADAVISRAIVLELSRRDLSTGQKPAGHSNQTSEAEPNLHRLVLRIRLNDYGSDAEVAEHVAELVDAMSRWQIANGGNPIEIEKLLPMVCVGEGVPRG